MALETLINYPNCGLKIVPCGMNYFNAHKFRSRCVVEFGRPLEINPELVKMYTGSSEERKTAIGTVLNKVQEALRAVTVTTPDYETLMVRVDP
jgi:glycerol-3-phosphate O-acyltransferase/dihydroxyacetone phosphate acyltransferase